MKTETKIWPTAVVLSLYTGRLLCEFSQMHELAEYLVGSSVWTHQFAHRLFVEEMQRALVQQIPALASVDASKVTTQNWKAFRTREVARLGDTLTVRPMGEPERYADAFTKPLEGKDVVVASSGAQE